VSAPPEVQIDRAEVRRKRQQWVEVAAEAVI
jgi:hypothetical protein